MSGFIGDASHHIIIAQTVYVPSSHWVYDYLDRLEVKRVLPVVLGGTKPMTRDEIAGLVFVVKKYSEAGGDLSRAEMEQLLFLQREFYEELQKYEPISTKAESRWSKIVEYKWIESWLPGFIYENGRNFFALEHGPFHFYWDPVFMRGRLYAEADTLSDQEQVFEDTNGFILWGSVGDHVGFLTDIRDTKEWGTRAYPGIDNFTREGLGFVRGGGDHFYHDETVAYLTYKYKYVTLQFGKDSNRWGPFSRGQLGISDNATSYDQFKIQLQTNKFKFTSLWAVLKQYTPDYFNGNHQEKYLAAHRLEFSPLKELDIGLYETVVYSDRQFEPSYLNPVMFFRSAEHYQGDRDNVLMGLDVEVKLVPKTKLYGELFIDDITTSKLGTGFYGNKYAYQVGALYVDLLGLSNVDARVEFTRIRPFTYTHKFDLTSYTHFTTGLGHWLGPNAENLYAELGYRYSRRLSVKGFYERQRHGANPEGRNFGGDILNPRDAAKDPFLYFDILDGIRENRTSFGFTGRYEVLRNGFVELYYRYSDSETKFSELSQILFPGYPGNRSEFRIGLSLNY